MRQWLYSILLSFHESVVQLLHVVISDFQFAEFISILLNHRRRIELEDMAKVIASDWGTESLPRYSCFASVYLGPAEFNHLRGKTASAARILSPNQT